MHINKYVVVTLSVMLFWNQLRMTIHILILTSMLFHIPPWLCVCMWHVACAVTGHRGRKWWLSSPCYRGPAITCPSIAALPLAEPPPSPPLIGRLGPTRDLGSSWQRRTQGPAVVPGGPRGAQCKYVDRGILYWQSSKCGEHSQDFITVEYRTFLA